MNAVARRSTFTNQPVTYAAVGATLEADIAIHPPKGFKSSQRSIRLGSGSERFATSTRALMTWGIQRASGVEVTRMEPGTGEEYAGIRYAEDGTPESLISHRGAEAVYDEDGNPYISNGMTAVLKLPLGLFHKHAPVRVVYVIEETRRVGYGYGTMPGNPLAGEESFMVEHRDDDSVWLVMRSFFASSGGLGATLARGRQKRLDTRYIRALHPAAGTPGVGVQGASTDDAEQSSDR